MFESVFEGRTAAGDSFIATNSIYNIQSWVRSSKVSESDSWLIVKLGGLGKSSKWAYLLRQSHIFNFLIPMEYKANCTQSFTW